MFSIVSVPPINNLGTCLITFLANSKSSVWETYNAKPSKTVSMLNRPSPLTSIKSLISSCKASAINWNLSTGWPLSLSAFTSKFLYFCMTPTTLNFTLSSKLSEKELSKFDLCVASNWFL